MSDTIVDMAKVTQMLDAKWHIELFKNDLGSYGVRAKHPNELVMERVCNQLIENMSQNTEYLKATGQRADEAVAEVHFMDDWLFTDDFTPQQALTRMAYKVHGQIL